MKQIPQDVSESVRRRNPHLYGMASSKGTYVDHSLGGGMRELPTEPPKQIRKPLLNDTEARYKLTLQARGVVNIMDQAITLRLDPPFKRYTPDLAYLGQFGLTLVEVKGPHRFREKGIAKAALAAKTYPQFRFELADWTGSEFEESMLSP